MEEQANYFIDRELSRLFFLTGYYPEPSLDYIEQNGKRRISSSIPIAWNIYNCLPDNITIQDWKDPLPLQLNLWRIASKPDLPLQSVVNLLFQIIEAENPNQIYPDYKDSAQSPDPKTECKLLRHLVSHQGDIESKQLKNYCEYIGLPGVFYDPMNTQFSKLIKSKVLLLKDVARQVIMEAITRL